jgi:probable phosphoglycerate mutase
MPADVAARADRVIARVCALQGRIAVFSHGQFGAALAARWIGLPLLAGQHLVLHPASLSILGHDERHPGRRIITLWNQTATSCGSG